MMDHIIKAEFGLRMKAGFSRLRIEFETAEGCRFRRKWHRATANASSVSVGEGLTAVACADGNLLLLETATGRLVRYTMLFIRSCDDERDNAIQHSRPRS